MVDDKTELDVSAYFLESAQSRMGGLAKSDNPAVKKFARETYDELAKLIKNLLRCEEELDHPPEPTLFEVHHCHSVTGE